MTLLCAGILLCISLFFYGSVRGFILPYILKKNPEMQIVSFSWITGIVFFISLIVSDYTFSLFNQIQLNLSYILFLFLGGFAFLLMPLLATKNTKWQILTLFLFCLGGTFLIPPPSGEFLTPVNIAIRFGGALFWCMIILMNTVLDRIPLFSYITNTSAFVILALSCTSFANIVPYSYFYSFILIIILNMSVFHIFKKVGILVYTFPMVFLLNWIVGYILLHYMYTKQVIYIPTFFGFGIMEILIAIGANFYTQKRFFPVSVPFVTEQAFELNIPLKSIVKKIFYTTFIIMFLSMIAIKVSETRPSALYVYAIVFIVLYSSYRVLSGKSEGTSLWAAMKDVKMGMGVLKGEMSTFFAQKLDKVKTKISENQPVDSNKTNLNDNKNEMNKPETISK